MFVVAVLALVILQIVQIVPVHGLYMGVTTEPRCFRIDKPRDTPVTFHYEVLDAGDKASFSLYYGEEAVSDMAIMKVPLEDARGTVDYVTDVDGIHTYCLVQESQPKALAALQHPELHTKKDAGSTAGIGGVEAVYAHPTRVLVHINYGWTRAHYAQIATEENFDAVNMEVREVNDMLDLALAEADYQKYKEMEYHEETEAMNTAALWWPVAQIGILLLIAGFQVRHLKHFFKQNKLI